MFKTFILKSQSMIMIFSYLLPFGTYNSTESALLPVLWTMITPAAPAPRVSGKLASCKI